MSFAAIVTCALLATNAGGWKAGEAKVAITPTEPVWMAGYGARTKPSEGAVHDLWAKALVLEDPAGRKAVLVTIDVCGVGRELTIPIRKAIESRLGIERDRIVLSCSHTHCGPAVGTNLLTAYPVEDVHIKKIEQYAQFFANAIPEVVFEASKRLEPASLSWGTGRADYAVNRRANKEADVPALRAKGALQGPVDHDVPVLRVDGADGKPRAIVFGYACHCTVLSFYQFCGDHAGFAQIAIEKANPGAQAMFVAGCGADQNPLPRKTIELAEKYGLELADAVQRVVGGPLQAVEGSLQSAYEEIDLPFGKMPERSQLEAEATSKTLANARRAKKLLGILDTKGSFAPTYPYPVQVWKLGELSWVLLGGEVVVDYSLRLKRNLGSSHIWVSSYCNDVMGYIPSLRVLKEGGYEGATSMVPYSLPTTWGESVEEDVVASVMRLRERLEKPATR